MKNRFVMLLFAALILFSSCGIGSALTETRLSTNPSAQWNPSLWGNYIVWQDARNGGSDIYLTDMKTKVQTRVTKGVNAQSPCVAGTKIVWSDDRNGNFDVYMYDISTKKTTRITSDKANQMNPELYDKYIVWIDDGREYADVCLYDMTTKKVIRITEGTYVESVEIYANKIAWSNYYSGSVYDIKTKKTDEVCGPYPFVVAIHGAKILYYDLDDLNEGSDSRTYIYDYSKDKTTKITLKGSASAMYSNKIVYTDERKGNTDVYMAQI